MLLPHHESGKAIIEEFLAVFFVEFLHLCLTEGQGLPVYNDEAFGNYFVVNALGKIIS